MVGPSSNHMHRNKEITSTRKRKHDIFSSEYVLFRQLDNLLVRNLYHVTEPDQREKKLSISTHQDTCFKSGNINSSGKRVLDKVFHMLCLSYGSLQQSLLLLRKKEIEMSRVTHPTFYTKTNRKRTNIHVQNKMHEKHKNYLPLPKAG